MTAGVFSSEMRNQFILDKVVYELTIVRLCSTRAEERGGGGTPGSKGAGARGTFFVGFKSSLGKS